MTVEEFKECLHNCATEACYAVEGLDDYWLIQRENELQDLLDHWDEGDGFYQTYGNFGHSYALDKTETELFLRLIRQEVNIVISELGLRPYKKYQENVFVWRGM